MSDENLTADTERQLDSLVMPGPVKRMLSVDVRENLELTLRENLKRFPEIAEQEITRINTVRKWHIKLGESIITTVVGDEYDKDDYLHHFERSREFNYYNKPYRATEA